MLKKDYKLFISLFLWALIPSIYTLVRLSIVDISGVDINILGQMEWFDLIDEIISTALLVPLYFLLKPDLASKERNFTSFIISFGIYLLFTIIISVYIGNIAEFMAAEYAVKYLSLQAISMLFGFIGTFMIMLLTLNNESKIINILILSKITLLIAFDIILIPIFSDIGASYSEISTNIILSIIALVITYKQKCIAPGKTSIAYLKDWIRVGFFSGTQIFLDNFIYAVMIVKMVNIVSEAGNYWVANNFIWGWLLIPVSCIAEIIKKNNLDRLIFSNTWKFALIISGLWVISIPCWDWFLTNVMSVESAPILNILFPLVFFYFSYIISAFIDAWFISKGKTVYMAIISVFVNIVYYGIVFILFKQGVFATDLSFIIQMFGWGMIAHLIISIILYIYEMNKMKNIG